MRGQNDSCKVADARGCEREHERELQTVWNQRKMRRGMHTREDTQNKTPNLREHYSQPKRPDLLRHARTT